MRSHQDRPWFPDHSPSPRLQPLSRRRHRNPRARHLPWLEVLENRLVLSSISWINPDGGDWDTVGNWSSDTVPTASDNVTISIPVTNPITHSASVADSVDTITSQDPIALSAGSLAIAAASTLSSVTLSGGELTGSGNLDVSTSFQWTGGTLAGTGTLALGPSAQMTLAGGTSTVLTGGGQTVNSTAAGAAVIWSSGTLEGTLNIAGNFSIATSAAVYLYGGTLNLSDGTGTWTGLYNLYIDNNSTFTIGAGSTLDAQADVTIQHVDGIANDTSEVVVAGTLEKTEGNGTTIDMPVNDSGSIDVLSGAVYLDGGGASVAERRVHGYRHDLVRWGHGDARQ